MKESASIGEIAARMKLKPSAIRFYESEGLLEPARRRSGRRIYDDSICGRIALIQLARKAGFTVAEIRTLFHDFPSETPAGDRWRHLVVGKQREVHDKLEELQRMLTILKSLEKCGCAELDQCSAAALEWRPS